MKKIILSLIIVVLLVSGCVSQNNELVDIEYDPPLEQNNIENNTKDNELKETIPVEQPVEEPIEQNICEECNNNEFCRDNECIEEKCIKIFGSSDPSKTFNLFVVPVNYPEDKLLWEKDTYDLNDMTVNFENDVYRNLFSESEEMGYGLLIVEPLSSNVDKINVFILPDKTRFERGDDIESFYREELLTCEYYDEGTHIHYLIGEKQSEKYRGWFGMSGSLYSSSSFREESNGFENTITVFRHEFGHSLGLHDIYGNAFGLQEIDSYYSHNEWAEKWGYTDRIYNNFWDYYEGEAIGIAREGILEDGMLGMSNDPPNCDFTAGCPKWCDGDPIDVEGLNPCEEYTDEESCNEQVSGKPDCTWYTDPHPYFETNCIPEPISFEHDIGQECIEGAGCYFGCDGMGFRSHPHGDLAAQSIDSTGVKHGYDAASERFIKEFIECCYPQDCDNYDYSMCNLFVEEYQHKSYNDKERLSSCNICEN